MLTTLLFYKKKLIILKVSPTGPTGMQGVLVNGHIIMLVVS